MGDGMMEAGFLVEVEAVVVVEVVVEVLGYLIGD